MTETPRVKEQRDVDVGGDKGEVRGGGESAQLLFFAGEGRAYEANIISTCKNRSQIECSAVE